MSAIARHSMMKLLLGCFLLFILAGCSRHTPKNDKPALVGVVSSSTEGRMEGVLVSAKRDGSRITVTVVSDASGSYHFPSDRLQAGNYRLSVRAIGYELNEPIEVEVKSGETVTVGLLLKKA